MREPKDGNKDDQESLLYFLVVKTFNHLVVFIYNSIRILVLILILRFPSIELVFFCGKGDHPHRGDLSIGCRRYLISALHPQASAEALEDAQATQAAPATLAGQAGPATLVGQAAPATLAGQAAQSVSCHSARLCIA